MRQTTLNACQISLNSHAWRSGSLIFTYHSRAVTHGDTISLKWGTLQFEHAQPNLVPRGDSISFEHGPILFECNLPDLTI